MRHVSAHNRADEQKMVDHLADLVRPGGSVYLVDVDCTAVRMLVAGPDNGDLNDKYIEFHRRRGNDLIVGLRLAQLLTRAGLKPIAFEGRYSIGSPPPGVRPRSWAARHAMIAEQVATHLKMFNGGRRLSAYRRIRPSTNCLRSQLLRDRGKADLTLSGMPHRPVCSEQAVAQGHISRISDLQLVFGDDRSGPSVGVIGMLGSARATLDSS
jgi:hypothetical protein